MSNVQLSLALLTLSACVAQDTTSGGDTIPPQAPNTPDGQTPDGQDPEGAQSTLAGEYQLRSTLGLTVGSTLPPPAYELLRDLEDDPGAALVTIAEAAGLPAADLLFDALPSSLSGKVTGWMSAAIDSSGELQTLMSWSNLVLAEMELASTLTIDELDQDDHASAKHVLNRLIFSLDGREIEEEIPTITALPGAGHADLEIWLDSDSEGEHLVLGEQRFGLLFGEAAYRAFQKAVQSRYGTDVRGLLGQSVGCAAMAEEVSNKCVLGVCVGHASELEGLCDAALDEVSDRIHAEFTAFDTEILRFRSGAALLGTDDSQQSLLQTGEWDVAGDFGLGLRDLEGTFTGAEAQ